MNKCDFCEIRKSIAMAFDLHWFGEDDCPYDECPIDKFDEKQIAEARKLYDEKYRL